MLKPKEIKSLAKKLKWDLETTKYCLQDVFSENGNVIDNQVIFEEDICDFLRFCTVSSNYKDRQRHLFKEFLGRFMNRDPALTVAYFAQDIFFSGLLVYLYQTERSGKLKPFRHIELDDPNIKRQESDRFYWAMMSADIQERDIDTMDYWMVEIEIGNVLDSLMRNYPIYHGHISGLDIISRYKYQINLATEVIKKVGFQIFLSNTVRDAFVQLEGIGSRDLLRHASKELLRYGTDGNTEYIFIYCLSEKLKSHGVKAEETYELISDLLGRSGMSESSVRRRYFETKKEIKNKKESLESLISKNNLHKRLEVSLNSILSKIQKDI